MSTHKFTSATAGAIIIANMIGTGVFTSLGFQLQEIQSGFVLLMLWVIGGVTALCGALSYAELGAALPRSGGEYHFLGRIYHPAAGFVSGWISATMGFSAPTALVAITFGHYFSSAFPGVSVTWLACFLVVVVTFFHSISHRHSGYFQCAFTLIKLCLIIAFCILCILFVDHPQPVVFKPTQEDMPLLLSGACAVSLIYVNYAYTGWNAVTYVTGELHRPERYLPLVLTVSTAVVMLLYVALNFVFLYAAPISAMTGKVEIAHIVAQHVFGDNGARVISLVLSLLLISTVSAMLLAGPRVLQVMGEDHRLFKWFSLTNRDGIPVKAIYFQGALTLFFVLTSSFDSILIFSGFTLGVNSFFTVIGVFILRYTQPDLQRPYKIRFFPWPPLVFLTLILWTLVYIAYHRPEEALWGFLIIVSGVVFYVLLAAVQKQGKSVN